MVHWAMTTSPSTLITRASRYRPTQHSCNRRIEATLYTSSHVARTNPRSAAMVANRPSEVLDAPTAPQIDHRPPYNQSCEPKIDSRLSNRCDSIDSRLSSRCRPQIRGPFGSKFVSTSIGTMPERSGVPSLIGVHICFARNDP